MLILALLFSCFGKSNSLAWKPFINNIIRAATKTTGQMTMRSRVVSEIGLPTWESLTTSASTTITGLKIIEQDQLRTTGGGAPHTDAKIRLFGSSEEPRLTFYRDTAGWCPYCQKVWIFLEEKRIPYKIEKINMRSYGDKPPAFLRLVPNGLLPAIILDGRVQTESLDIMLNLDRQFTGPKHPSMWPVENSPELPRAKALMRLERELFSLWCNLVFRPSMGNSARQRFEQGLDEVNKELSVTSSPWFLNDISIVDFTYVSHVERMAASIAYWNGFKIRGDGRWPALERWLTAFEEKESYMATKSDYYTHIMDIPPQYGPGYSTPGSEAMAKAITGQDGAWTLPLSPFRPDDIEPVSVSIDPGDQNARNEAALKLARNRDNIVKFSLRAVGSPGAKQFQAPLADPYAVPALEYSDDMHACLRHVVHALLQGYDKVPSLQLDISSSKEDSEEVRSALKSSLAYLRDRIGVPRDMSYPAARQLRAHLNWTIEQL
eukprot:gene8588-17717_t